MKWTPWSQKDSLLYKPCKGTNKHQTLCHYIIFTKSIVIIYLIKHNSLKWFFRSCQYSIILLITLASPRSVRSRSATNSMYCFIRQLLIPMRSTGKDSVKNSCSTKQEFTEQNTKTHTFYIHNNHCRHTEATTFTMWVKHISRPALCQQLWWWCLLFCPLVAFSPGSCTAGRQSYSAGPRRQISINVNITDVKEKKQIVVFFTAAKLQEMKRKKCCNEQTFFKFSLFVCEILSPHPCWSAHWSRWDLASGLSSWANRWLQMSLRRRCPPQLQRPQYVPLGAKIEVYTHVPLDHAFQNIEFSFVLPNVDLLSFIHWRAQSAFRFTQGMVWMALNK